MAVKFPDEIHPSEKLVLKFDFWSRPMQYLEYFGIIKRECDKEVNTIAYTFTPLNLRFDDAMALEEYLRKNSVIYKEKEVGSFTSQVKNTFYCVDCRKIDEAVSKSDLSLKYYSINEVADMLSMSRPTVYKLIKDGEIRAGRINNQLRVNHVDLVGYIYSSS